MDHRVAGQPIVRIVLQLIVPQHVPSHALHGSMPTVPHQALPPVVAHRPVPDHLVVQVLAALRLVVRNLVVRLLVKMRRCSVVPTARSMTALAT